MKTNPRLLLIVMTISLVALFGWGVRGQQTPAQKVVWEHAVVSSLGDNSNRLSQLGSEGWELVAVRSEEKLTGNFRQMEVFYYLKRPNPPLSEGISRPLLLQRAITTAYSGHAISTSQVSYFAPLTHVYPDGGVEMLKRIEAARAQRYPQARCFSYQGVDHVVHHIRMS